MTELQTPRLRLRLHRADDADPLLSYYSDPETVRLTPHEPWTAETAQTHVKNRLARTAIRRPGDALALVVEHEDRVVGDVVLWTTDYVSTGEVGWALDERARGHGFASEAVDALLRHAFDDLGMHRVSASVDPRNQASVRVCRRIGMQREGHLRSDYFCKDEWCDTLVFARLRGASPHDPHLDSTTRASRP